MKTLVVAITIAAVFLPVSLVLAADPPCPTDAICLPNFLEAANFGELMDKIIGFLIVLAVPLSVLATIICGFQLMLYGDNPAKRLETLNRLKWTFIGLASIFFAKGLMSAIRGLLGA